MEKDKVINKRKTKHGLIDVTTGKYITHRLPRHYFRKFHGFGISESEIELMEKHNCSVIMLKYFTLCKNFWLKISLEDIRKSQEYYDSGDKQYILQMSSETKFQEENVHEGFEFKGYIEHFGQYMEA